MVTIATRDLAEALRAELGVYIDGGEFPGDLTIARNNADAVVVSSIEHDRLRYLSQTEHGAGSSHPQGPTGAAPISDCPNCSKPYPDRTPGHSTGCVIGALLTVLEDRGFDFDGTRIAAIDADGWWSTTFGPAADRIEDELNESRKEDAR